MSGIDRLYNCRIGSVEMIPHKDNYELHKDGHSAFYDKSERTNETLEDFADYFIEAQQTLIRI